MVLSLLVGALLGAPIEVRVHTGHQANVISMAFSPDGKIAATGGNDGALKIWDTRTWRELRSVSFTEEFQGVGDVSFSRDGRRIAAVGNKVARIHSRSGALLREFASDEYTVSARLDRRGKLLVTSAPYERKWRVWNAESGALIRAIDAPGADLPGAAAVSPDGKRIATTAGDKFVIYEVASGKLLHKPRLGEDFGEARAIDWSADGKRIATADTKFLRIRDAGGKLLHSYEPTTGANSEGDPRVVSVRFSADGKRLAVGHAFGKVSVWNAATLTREFESRLDDVTVGTSAEASAALSPDGRYLIAADTDSLAMHIFDLSTKRKIRVVRGSVANVFALRFAPDGNSLVAGSKAAHGARDKRSWNKTWDLRSGRITRTEAGDETEEVARTPGGRLAVIAVGSANNRAHRLMDRRSGATLGEYKYQVVKAAALSDDGKQLAIAYWQKVAKEGEYKLDLYRTGERSPSRTLPAGEIHALAFSPDGSALALGGSLADHRYGLCLWDLRSSDCKRLDDVHEIFVNQLAFIGGVLFSGDAKGQVHLWDASSRAHLGTLAGFVDSVLHIWPLAGGRIVALGRDGSLREFDLRERKQLRALETRSSVRAFARSEDGKRLALSTGDGQLHLIDVEKLEVIATLVTLEGDDNESITITPDGYYTATRHGTSAVHFAIGEKTYLVDQFDLRFNRPDIVAERLGAAPPALRASFKRAWQKRLRKMGFTEESISGEINLPEISLQNLPPPNTREKKISLIVKSADAQRFIVLVNDGPMNGSKGIEAQRAGKGIEIELTKGLNRIQVSALNAAGLESLRETVEVTYDGESPKPDLYVVTIGVSKYSDPQYELRYAAKDAGDVAALFAARGDRYGAVKVIKLLDADATRAGVAKAKEALMGSRVDDRIVAFAAGHGVLDDKLDFYFATADVDFSAPSAAGLPYEDLEGMLDGPPARQKLLLIDTCHSGEIDKEEMMVSGGASAAGGTVRARAVGTRGVKRKEGSRPALDLGSSMEAVQNLFADLRRGSGASVISSAGGAEYALESPEWNNGVFTFAVLEGLKSGNADRDKDGQVRVSELRDYVIDKVQKLTAGKQTPTSRRESLEFDFAIY